MHERKIDDMDKRLNKVKLSHQLLSKLHVISLLLLQIIFVFRIPSRNSGVSLQNMVLF